MARHRFALPTWTLDSTPLARLLEIARAGGWEAVAGPQARPQRREAS